MLVSMFLNRDLRDRLVALTACCAPLKAGPPALSCVHFEGRYAWATDAYVLARVDLFEGLPEDEAHPLPERVMVPAAALATYLRRSGKRSEVTLEFYDDAVTVCTVREDLMTRVADDVTIDYLDAPGPHPDFAAIWPDEIPDVDDGRPPAFNAALLERLAKTVRFRTPDGHPILRVYTRGGLKPLVVADERNEIVGVVMPIRTELDRPASKQEPSAPAEAVA